MRLSAAPTPTADPTPRQPETASAAALKSEPATQPKAEPSERPKAQSRVEPATQPKAAPKATVPEPSVKAASRRSDELKADAPAPAPKRAAPAPTPAEPAQSARSVAGTAQRGPSVGAGSPAATPEKDAANLVARLESAYAAMNADRFAALFTANARVNEGTGRGLIRSKYADLFQRTTGAKLSIGNVRWRSMPDGRIRGSGAISVGNRYRGAGGWRYASGGVDFELVRDGGGYRIASMIYRMN
jgi:hypothetical protein